MERRAAARLYVQTEGLLPTVSRSWCVFPIGRVGADGELFAIREHLVRRGPLIARAERTESGPLPVALVLKFAGTFAPL